MEEGGNEAWPGTPRVALKVSEQIAPQKRSVKISTNFHFVIIYRKRGFLPWPASHQASRKKSGKRKPLKLIEACLLIGVHVEKVKCKILFCFPIKKKNPELIKSCQERVLAPGVYMEHESSLLWANFQFRARSCPGLGGLPCLSRIRFHPEGTPAPCPNGTELSFHA